MVECNSRQLDLVFHALADETRRAILSQISRQARTVTEIARAYRISLNGVSKHLKILEKAGLMVRKKDGRIHYCRMDPRPLEEVEQFIKYHQKFWGKQLDALERFLAETKE